MFAACLVFLILGGAEVRAGRIIQSDNRKTYQTYFPTFQEKVGKYDYRGYSCFSKGWRKIALVKEACRGTDFVLWVDSDALIRDDANITELMETSAHLTKKHLLVAGIEESNTIRVIENFPSFVTTFTEFLNDGTFAVRCSPGGIRFLDAWQRATEYWQETQGEVSDQKTLQLLANRLSVYANDIKFDALAFGASSKFIRHYPGLYRMGMPRAPRKVEEGVWACPVLEKKIKYGTTMAGKMFYLLISIAFLGFFIVTVTKFSCKKKEKI